jgi:hypothetical protein
MFLPTGSEAVGSALLSILNPTAPNKMASGPVFFEDAYKQIVPHLKRLTARTDRWRNGLAFQAQSIGT